MVKTILNVIPLNPTMCGSQRDQLPELLSRPNVEDRRCHKMVHRRCPPDELSVYNASNMTVDNIKCRIMGVPSSLHVK